MDFNENGTLTVDKGSKKKVKCYKFNCPEIKRTLIIHEDIDNKNHTSVSDFVTGYRLFSLPVKATAIKMESVQERLNWFIGHFTKDAIAEEFERIEKIINSTGK